MSIFDRATAISIDQSGLINTLRSNLESYPEDSVLREMLQNADDGGAKHFSILYSPKNNKSETKNSFGAAARLIVMNDGDVNDDQFTAMTQLRAASQVDDNSKIGKFGLGLKSVFHWCDIFWILRVTPVDSGDDWTLDRFETVTLPGIELGKLMNPIEIESVYEDVKKQVLQSELPTGSKSLLVFVLPLRDESTIKALAANKHSPLAAASTRFPQFMQEEHNQLSNYIPSLANIESIGTVVGDTKMMATMVIDTASSSEKVSASSRLERHQTNRERVFYSESQIIHKVNGEIVKSSPVLLQASEHMDAELTKLASSRDWPTVNKVDKSGNPITVPERSVQSSGVICIHTGTDRVRIRHATYLPLHNVISSITVSSGNGFDILIHGTFHTDPGRAEVLSRTKTSESDRVRIDWNRILFTNYVSRQLLYSVFTYVRRLAKLPKRDESAIYAGIAAYRSIARETFGDEEITSACQIVLRTTSDFQTSFELYKAFEPVFHLPPCLLKHIEAFADLKGQLDDVIWTTQPDKGLLSYPALPCENPLKTFGFTSALDANDDHLTTTLTLFNDLAGAEYVKFTDPSESQSIAAHHRLATGKALPIKADKIEAHPELVTRIRLSKVHFEPFVTLLKQEPELFSGTDIVLTVSTQLPAKEYQAITHRPFIMEMTAAAEVKITTDRDWSVTACEIVLDMLRNQALEGLRDGKSKLVPVQVSRDGAVELWSIEKCIIATSQGKLSQTSRSNGTAALWNLVRSEPVPVIYGISLATSSSYKIGRDPSDVDIIKQITSNEPLSDDFVARCKLASNFFTVKRGETSTPGAVAAAFRLLEIAYPKADSPILLTSQEDPEVLIDVLTAFGCPLIGDSISGAVDVLIEHQKMLEASNLVFRASPDLARAKVAAHSPERFIQFANPLQVRAYLKESLLLGNEFIRKLPVFKTSLDNFVVLGTSEDLFVLTDEQVIAVQDYSLEVITFDPTYMVEADLNSFDAVVEAVIKNECANAASPTKPTRRVLKFWEEAKKYVGEKEFVKSVHDYLMPLALEGGSVWATSNEFPTLLRRALRKTARLTFYSDDNHPDAAKILATFDPKYRFDLLPQLRADSLPQLTGRIDPKEWFDFWADECSDLEREDVESLSTFAASLTNDALVFGLPIHLSSKNKYVQVGKYSDMPVCEADNGWISVFDDAFTYVPGTPITQKLATADHDIFDKILASFDDETAFDALIRSNLKKFEPLFDADVFFSRLRSRAIFGTESNPVPINRVLSELPELEEAREALCTLLGYCPKVDKWVQKTALYRNTRRGFKNHIHDLCRELDRQPETDAAASILEPNPRIATGRRGLGELASSDYLVTFAEKLATHSDAVFSLLGIMLLRLPDNISELTELLNSLKYAYVPDIVQVLKLAKSYPVSTTQTLPAPLVATLVALIATPGLCADYSISDFPVVTASNQWADASQTTVTGANIPDDHKLHEDLLNHLPEHTQCFESQTVYSDLSSLFGGSPLWAEFDFLVGTITAIVGTTDRDKAFAQDSLGTAINLDELLESAPKRPKSPNFNFVVRKASEPTKFVSCYPGKFVDVVTPETELTSLVDDVIFTDKVTKVLFVLPDTVTKVEDISDRLVDLIGDIYWNHIDSIMASEFTNFVGQYRSRGQSSVRKIQAEILSNISFYLHKVGITDIPDSLLTATKDYLIATQEVLKQTNSLVQIRNKRSSMPDAEFKSKNSDVSKQLFSHSRARTEAETKIRDLFESSEPEGLQAQSEMIHAFRKSNMSLKLFPDSIYRMLFDSAKTAMFEDSALSENNVKPNYAIAIEATSKDVYFGYEGRPLNSYSDAYPTLEYEFLYMLEPTASQTAGLHRVNGPMAQCHSKLGFGAVHLVSKSVSIASKDLVTQINGCIWPKVLDRESQKSLREWKRSHGLSNDSTAILLKDTSNTVVPSDLQVLYSLCFSAILERVSLKTSSARVEYEKIQRRQYGENIALVTIKKSHDSTFAENLYFMSLSTKPGQAEFLVRIGADGALSEPALPAHWCGQPVRDNISKGFAVNFAFPVHTDYQPVDISDNHSNELWVSANKQLDECKRMLGVWSQDINLYSSFRKDACLSDEFNGDSFVQSVINVLNATMA
jgi:hypothetical protein